MTFHYLIICIECIFIKTVCKLYSFSKKFYNRQQYSSAMAYDEYHFLLLPFNLTFFS